MEQTSFRILELLLKSYKIEEFPALLYQMKEWGDTKPFHGLSVLDSSPIFLNTFAKYAALIEGGANLCIGVSSSLPPSPDALDLASRLGIPIIEPGSPSLSFDIVLDCAGEFRHMHSRLGYVELTRSGVHLYSTMNVPVWSVDSGRIKQIETSLGTGDGFIRAMKELGHEEWKHKKLVVFGYGKVGLGIVLRARLEGADVVVVDLPEKRHLLPEGVSFISLNNPGEIRHTLMSSFCAVTATGVRNAIQSIFDVRKLVSSPVLLANMGVEDEWGYDIPTARVLNDKKALNFILRDPTRMPYIDPAMALHNAGALELSKHDFPPGISIPSYQLEQEYIHLIREKGIIREEMNLIGLS